MISPRVAYVEYLSQAPWTLRANERGNAFSDVAHIPPSRVKLIVRSQSLCLATLSLPVLGL